MKQLVIGLGEVGTAIKNILECDGYDRDTYVAGTFLKQYDVLHICFPYTDGFETSVLAYVKTFRSSLVVVHSTVPIGTCDPYLWVHSPIRGVHPELEKGIRTFRKFFGGLRASEAAPLFFQKGVLTTCVQTARDTEAMKLWDTTIYGWNILIEKAIKAYCEKNGVDFDVVYRQANLTYNHGYRLMGKKQFTKYNLTDFPGPVGGHCIRPNWELLDDPIAEISKQLHKDLTGE